MAEHGIAMISLHAVSAEVKAGQLALLQLPDVPMPTWWYAVRPTARQTTPAAQAYLDFLKQRWPELDESLLELLQARSFPTAHIKKTNAKEY